MSGFSGNDTQNSTTIVKNDGWWPDLAISKFQESYRMPTEYAEGMMVEGIVLSMAWANRQLQSWRASQNKSIADLASVAAPQLNEESLLLVYYRKAVFSHAKSWLLIQYATTNRREAANNEARESSETEETFLEYALQAIADFQDVDLVTVELI